MVVKGRGMGVVDQMRRVFDPRSEKTGLRGF